MMASGVRMSVADSKMANCGRMLRGKLASSHSCQITKGIVEVFECSFEKMIYLVGDVRAVVRDP